ncbi:unnamed protein product [Leptosia nina]|uniref:Copia protein n=1 Tax=Leptosia nina TaxID=320188 RepID=A0AAV1JES6_9NEOP
MEAEYMAIAEASKEAIYLRMLLCELTGNLYPVKLYNDSQSAQKLVANPVCHRKSKHIDIRYHSVKDVVNDKIIDLKYLPTSAMPADVLTKALSPMKHYKCMAAQVNKRTHQNYVKHVSKTDSDTNATFSDGKRPEEYQTLLNCTRGFELLIQHQYFYPTTRKIFTNGRLLNIIGVFWPQPSSSPNEQLLEIPETPLHDQTAHCN